MNDRRVSVEVELTSKWDRHLDQFVLSTILSLVSSDQSPARFDTVLVLTDSPAIQVRYPAQFEPGAKFNRWVKDGPENTSKWRIHEQLTVPREIFGKVVCQLFESF